MIRKKALLFLFIISACFTCAYALDPSLAQTSALPASNSSDISLQEEANAHFSRGSAWFYKKNYKKALMEFNKALSYEPDMLAAICWKAKTFYSMGDYRSAADECNAALEIAPNDQFSLQLRAQAWEKIAEQTEAPATSEVSTVSSEVSTVSNEPVTENTPQTTEAGPSPRKAENIPSQEAENISTSEGHYRANISLAALSATEPDRSIYYVDGIFPLYYADNGTTLLFLSPKQNWQEPYATETNLGIGFRKMFGDRYILGLNIFSDRAESVNEIWHAQSGVGLEYLSQPFDLRVNFYQPSDQPETLSVTDYGAGSYTFGPKNILLASGESGISEEALPGYDVEFGGPFFPLNLLNTRTYLGGFSYRSSAGDNVTGSRLRTETKVYDSVFLDLSVSTGTKATEFTGGIRASFPLELDQVFTIHSPLPSESLSYLKERMFERVVRDLDIKYETYPFGKGITETIASTTELIYVNNAASGRGADGTYAHPYTNIYDALRCPRYVGNPGGTANTIYIFNGNGAAYSGAYSLFDNNVTLWGSGYNGGFSSLPVSGQPLLTCNLTGDNIISLLGNNITVQGLYLGYAKTGGYGICADNVTGANIHDNTINGNAGIYIRGSTGGNTSDINIYNNVITNNTQGIFVGNTGATISNITISGNAIFSNKGDGIYIQNSSGTMEGFTFLNNTINSNTGEGFNIVNNGLMSDITIEANTITNDADGIFFQNSSGTLKGSMEGFTILYNTIDSNRANGLYFINNGLMSDLTIEVNTISSNIGNGIYIIDNSSGTSEGLLFQIT